MTHAGWWVGTDCGSHKTAKERAEVCKGSRQASQHEVLSNKQGLLSFLGAWTEA